ncbi:MAG: hypothetical protein BWY79_01810 [Actinobacteria bacterium ADurb.Bin444]|nr:MAG: hypothetical protein BWY79_01810 [Actinobacteria bacterium ADurb.Bin444]
MVGKLSSRSHCESSAETWALVTESRAERGSSSSSNSGDVATARARATRCRSPPDIRRGLAEANCPIRN